MSSRTKPNGAYITDVHWQYDIDGTRVAVVPATRVSCSRLKKLLDHEYPFGNYSVQVSNVENSPFSKKLQTNMVIPQLKRDEFRITVHASSGPRAT